MNGLIKKFKIKAEENPNLISALNATVSPNNEIIKVDEKLETLRIKFIDVKTTREEMAKVRGEINELLDKRLEWMKIQNEKADEKKKADDTKLEEAILATLAEAVMKKIDPDVKSIVKLSDKDKKIAPKKKTGKKK